MTRQHRWSMKFWSVVKYCLWILICKIWSTNFNSMCKDSWITLYKLKIYGQYFTSYQSSEENVLNTLKSSRTLLHVRARHCIKKTKKEKEEIESEKVSDCFRGRAVWSQRARGRPSAWRRRFRIMLPPHPHAPPPPPLNYYNDNY